MFTGTFCSRQGVFTLTRWLVLMTSIIGSHFLPLSVVHMVSELFENEECVDFHRKFTFHLSLNKECMNTWRYRANLSNCTAFKRERRRRRRKNVIIRQQKSILVKTKYPSCQLSAADKSNIVPRVSLWAKRQPQPHKQLNFFGFSRINKTNFVSSSLLDNKTQLKQIDCSCHIT